MGVRWGIHPDLDAGGHRCVCCCCWLLFLILFPLGIMNVAAMALVTLLIFAEKTLPAGRPIARVAGVALAVYGITVLAVPKVLPTNGAGDSMPMSMSGSTHGM